MTPPEAAAGAFEHHRLRVEAVAARILRDRDEARDVASEAFVALLEHGPVEERAVLPWLLTTARNRALNRVRERARAERRERRVFAGEHEPDPADEGAFGDDAAARVVRRALERLAARDREAVRLRFIEGLEYPAVAQALGVSGPQARVVVHRAARRLRAETVRLLAEHHRAEQACVARLVSRVREHQGCRACSAVVDEFAAMASYGLLPIAALPVALRIARGAGRAVASVRARSGPAADRLAEALVVLAVGGAMALPATETGPPPARLATHALAVAGTGSVTSGVSAAAAAAGRLARPGELRHVVTHADADEDAVLGSKKPLALLGVPLSLPDGLDLPGERGADIRSFTIATLAGADGAPSGVLFRFVLAGAPVTGASYAASWEYLEQGCYGSASLTRGEGSDGSAAYVGCNYSDAHAMIDGVGKEQGVFPDTQSRVNGNTVEILVRFPAGSFARLFAPGQTLVNLVANAGVGGVSQDRAPDDAEMRYRIEN